MNSHQRILVISLLILYHFLLVSASDQNNPYQIVKTNSGYVRGIRNYTLFADKPYYSFKGIPYAAPPIGNLRFKAPVSADPWNGVLDTFVGGVECLQSSTLFSAFKDFFPIPFIYGDEDCLYMNIYTPDVSGNFPVLFHIPGTTFNESPTMMYGPDFVINEDVLLVTFSYRLGPFGYMSLGTDEYSGNTGIKDTLFALQWVNENIERFGGDKNRITVSGYAGSASISHLLAVSETSKYLFQRAIMMSGSMLNIYAVNERKDHVEEMFDFARKTDESVKTFDDLVAFLQNVDGIYLVNYFIQDIYDLSGFPRKKIPNYIWSPIVKTPFNDHSKLFENTNKLLKNKVYNSSIDTMFGYTSKEVIFFIAREIQNPALLNSFNPKYEVQLPLNYDDDIHYNSNAYKRIAKKIHDFYFGPGVIVNQTTMSQYVDLLSDTWIRYAVDLSARIQAKSSTGKTFLFEYDVDDALNVGKIILNITLPGASEGDDAANIFRFPIPHLYDNVTPDSVEGKTIKRMTKIWTNFVKYGDPSVKEQLQPITNYQKNYFKITNNGIEIGKNPRGDAMALWDEIYADNYEDLLKTNILNG